MTNRMIHTPNTNTSPRHTLILTDFWHSAEVSRFEGTNESRPISAVCPKSCHSVADETRVQEANRVIFCGSASLHCRRDWNCCVSVLCCSVLTNCESTPSLSGDPKVRTQHSSYRVDKKNQLDVKFCILYFSSNSCSTCFGKPCAHHQELTTAWCYSLVLVCAVAAGRWSRPVGR